ncbi:MAG: Ig-like domain-containing protein, partial [Olleya sp.]
MTNINKHFLLLFAIFVGLCFNSTLQAQTVQCNVNYMLNPSMEDPSACPNLSTAGTINFAPNWQTSNAASGGQLMVVAPGCFSNRPAGSWPVSSGLNSGASGQKWLGMHTSKPNTNLTAEDIQNTLSQTMPPGSYRITFKSGWVYGTTNFYSQGGGSFNLYGIQPGQANYSTSNYLGNSGAVWNQLTTNNPNWQTYTFVFTSTVPFNRLFFKAIAGSSPTGSYMYFDDFKVEVEIANPILQVVGGDNCIGTSMLEVTNPDPLHNRFNWFVNGVFEATTTTPTYTPISVGNYSVTGSNNGGCPASSNPLNPTTIVNCCTLLDVTIAANMNNVVCFGDTTGELTATATGGTVGSPSDYTYSWDTNPVQTTATISNLAAGTYTVTATDANGCTATDSTTIIEPDTNVSASITSQIDIVCEGLGSLNVEGAGGIPPYSYSIDNGANYVTDGTFTNLAQGTYTVIVLDANGCSTSISTEILINCTDAIADINNTIVDQPVSGNVLTNDEDFEGDNQTVTANTNPANGTVIVNPDGTYTYTPNPGYTGEDTFDYTICDDGNPQACDTATVYIEVLPESGPENEAPIANADTATTNEGTPIDVVVIANDFDPDGDPISITGTTDPANGTVTINPDGTITYTPDPGFTGEDTFGYTICDDGNPELCDTTTVTVTVQNANTPNTTNANDDAYNTTPGADVTGNVLNNDNDIEGDTQTVTTTTVTTTEGVIVNIDPNTGVFTYTPNTGFSGTDSFVYSICDDGNPQACDDATVYILVVDLANTTDAIADINNTIVDQPVSGNVLTNDEDFEGDNQT